MRGLCLIFRTSYTKILFLTKKLAYVLKTKHANRNYFLVFSAISVCFYYPGTRPEQLKSVNRLHEANIFFGRMSRFLIGALPLLEINFLKRIFCPFWFLNQNNQNINQNIGLWFLNQNINLFLLWPRNNDKERGFGSRFYI